VTIVDPDKEDKEDNDINKDKPKEKPPAGDNS